MKSLQQLINELCPNGVEFKKLGEVCEIRRGERITKKEVSTTGTYPVISGGISPMGYVEKYNRTANTITVAQYGSAGFVDLQQHNFWANDICYSLYPQVVINNKFLYYLLKANSGTIDAMVNRDAVPYHLPRNTFEGLELPIPPIVIQEKIVEILDNFTALTAELQARQQQYEYYRDHLLSVGGHDNIQSDTIDASNTTSGWQLRKMGEIGTITRGKRFVRTDIVENGVPCIHYGDMYTFYGISASEAKTHLTPEKAGKMRFAKKNDVVIVGAGENRIDIGIGMAWLSDKPAAVHDACFIFTSDMNPKFVAHYLRTKTYHDELKKYVSEGKICSFLGKDLAEIHIPIPSLAEQQRIVDILDRFESLTNDLRSGLPAEIAARQQQYEYYRNRLLSFKRL